MTTQHPLASPTRTPRTAALELRKHLELRYTDELLGKGTLQRIIKYYNNGVALSDIIQIINGPRPKHQTINLADCYLILTRAMTQKKLKQRKGHNHLDYELKFSEFVNIFKAWRAGFSDSEIIKLHSGVAAATKRLLRSLYVRCREQKQDIEFRREIAATQILGLGQQKLIDSRLAIVIFVDEIPPEYLETVGLSSDIEDGVPEATETSSEITEENSERYGKRVSRPGTPERVSSATAVPEGTGNSSVSLENNLHEFEPEGDVILDQEQLETQPDEIAEIRIVDKRFIPVEEDGRQVYAQPNRKINEDHSPLTVSESELLNADVSINEDQIPDMDIYELKSADTQAIELEQEGEFIDDATGDNILPDDKKEKEIIEGSKEIILPGSQGVLTEEQKKNKLDELFG